MVGGSSNGPKLVSGIKESVCDACLSSGVPCVWNEVELDGPKRRRSAFWRGAKQGSMNISPQRCLCRHFRRRRYLFAPAARLHASPRRSLLGRRRHTFPEQRRLECVESLRCFPFSVAVRLPSSLDCGKSGTRCVRTLRPICHRLTWIRGLRLGRVLTLRFPTWTIFLLLLIVLLRHRM